VRKETKVMSDEKPSMYDKTVTETWSKKKCLEELHKHATNGHREWSKLLLERTKYETLPKFPVSDNAPDEVCEQVGE
jgi:hypothetical protein